MSQSDGDWPSHRPSGVPIRLEQYFEDIGDWKQKSVSEFHYRVANLEKHKEHYELCHYTLFLWGKSGRQAMSRMSQVTGSCCGLKYL